MQPLLSVVVPCYNEEKNLPLIIDAFTSIIKKFSFIEVVLVNNGSSDNSAVVLDNLLKNLSIENFKIVTVVENKGYGYGILQGLQNATANVLSWTHADMQTNPEDVVEAYEKYHFTNDKMMVVKGKRENRNWVDSFLTWGMEVYTNIVLNTALNDINAQPKVFSRKFYEAIKDNAPFDFSLDLYWLYKAKKMGIITTVPVAFLPRKYGEAKGGGTLKGKWKLIKRTIVYIHQLKKKL